MKKLLTLLTVIAVFAVGITVLAVSVLADDTAPAYTGTVEDARPLVDAVFAKPDDSKLTAAAAKALWNYLRVNKVNPAAEGYDALAADAVKALATGAVCELNTFDLSLPNYTAKLPVSYASQYVKYEFYTITPAAEEGGEATVETFTAADVLLADVSFAPASSQYVTVTEDLVTVKDYFDVVKAVMDKKIEESKKALYDAAPLDEQPFTNSMMVNTFNSLDSRIELTNASSSGATAYLTYEDAENTEGYYTIDFTSPSPAFTGSGAPYTGTYWNTSKMNERGIVFQWDYSYFSENSSVTVATTENSHNFIDASTGKAKRVGVNFISMSNTNVTSGSDSINCVVPGEWTNIILVIDPMTLTLKTYLDYELVNERNVAPKDDFVTVTHIRWTVGKGGMSSSFDNAYLYDGSAPRDVNFLKDMTADEQFAYFGSVLPEDMSADGVHFPSVNYAYTELKKALSYYFVETPSGSVSLPKYDGTVARGEYMNTNAAVRLAVAKYYAFDPTLLIEKMKVKYTTEYIEKVNALAALERKYTTISARSKAATEVDNFAFVNETYLDNANPDYANAVLTLEKIKLQVENDSLSLKFVDAAEAYVKMSSYRKKLESFNKMESEWLKMGGEEGIDFTIPDDRLAKAKAVYLGAPAELEALLKNENSKTLLVYLTPTLEYKTAESWAENYATISRYLKKARPIIVTGMYNPNYVSEIGNLSELLSWYATMDEYFYPRLQEEHASYLTVINEEYKSSDKYIVKLGAYNRMTQYIAENEITIDYTHSQIKKIFGEYSNYANEIEMLKNEYSSLLDDNAKAFVSVVRTLPVTTSYLDIKAAVNSASEYYYNMTVGSDETNAATVTYQEYAAYIKLVETSTEQFVLLLDAYDGATTLAEKYTILSAATNLLPYVDTGVTVYAGEGEDLTTVDIAEYLTKYDTLAVEYNVIKDSVNSETYTLNDVICALRANCESAGILAFFKQLSK